MGSVTLRSARWEDAEVVADLFNRIAREQYGTDDSTAEEVRRFWRSPRVELERDVVVAEAEDGTLVGYGDNFVEGENGEKVWMDVRGEPALDLIHDLERRGEQAGAARFFRLFVPDVAASVRGAAEAAGYRVVRESFRMVVDLDGDLPPAAWPEGVAVRTYRGEADERRVFEAQEETFADMWEYEPQPLEEWREWMLGERHDPDLWFLAEGPDGELAGICLCRTHEPGDPDMGWVSVLGVRRPWRRRGVALALLRHTFREFRARGRRRVGLGVDGESETGAVELYRRAGMEVLRRAEAWERRP